MSWINSKSLMIVFGFAVNGALIAYLTLYRGSPGPLSAAHAQAIDGASIKSCRQCHSDQGLVQGCLACHSEIAEQLDLMQGYHSYLLFEGSGDCHQCHPEHHGRAFPLVSDLAWPAQGSPAFNHPHVNFGLAGPHDGLSCAACHRDKLSAPFTLPGFPQQPRAATYLGLSQDCASCHSNPHRTQWDQGCQTCHFPVDLSWTQARCHMDLRAHAKTGFVLDGIHAGLTCDSCHPPQRLYAQRYLDLDGPRHARQSGNCRGCHQNPHEGNVQDRYESCCDCHDTTRLVHRWWQAETIWGK